MLDIRTVKPEKLMTRCGEKVLGVFDNPKAEDPYKKCLVIVDHVSEELEAYGVATNGDYWLDGECEDDIILWP
jgi:hypothetical protein